MPLIRMNIERDLRAAEESMSSAQRILQENTDPTAGDLRRSMNCVADAIHSTGGAVLQLVAFAEGLDRAADRARRGL